MKKFKVLFILSALILSFIGCKKKQYHKMEWHRFFGTPEIERAYKIAKDKNGNVYITGSSKGNFDTKPNMGKNDIFIIKYNTKGKKIWSTLFGTAEDERSGGIALDSSGNIFVAGTTYGTFGKYSNAVANFFIAKFNPFGKKLWLKIVLKPENQNLNSPTGLNNIEIDSNGNILICGCTNVSYGLEKNSDYKDAFIAKFNNKGKKLWIKLIGSKSGAAANSIVVDQFQNIFITGLSSGSIDSIKTNSNENYFIAKFNSKGIKQWIKLFPNSKSNGIALDCKGNIYITGRTFKHPGKFKFIGKKGSLDVFIAKFDTNGNLIWGRQIATSGGDASAGISVDSSLNVYIVGSVDRFFETNKKNSNFMIFISKLDSRGDPVWYKYVKTPSPKYANGILTDLASNVFIIGHTYGNFLGKRNLGSADIFFIKFRVN